MSEFAASIRFVAAIVLAPLLVSCALPGFDRTNGTRNHLEADAEQWPDDGGTYSYKYDPSIRGYRLSQDKRPQKQANAGSVLPAAKPLLSSRSVLNEAALSSPARKPGSANGDARRSPAT